MITHRTRVLGPMPPAWWLRKHRDTMQTRGYKTGLALRARHQRRRERKAERVDHGDE